MTPDRFDLLVFDWDGTLMDSTRHITQNLQNACAQLGLSIPSRVQASHVIGLGLDEALRTLCPELDTTGLQALRQAYHQQSQANHQQPEFSLFDGVVAALARYHAAGYLLAIATGHSRYGLDQVLQRTGLAPLFSATRTADECQSKPHPEMLEQLMEVLGISPQHTLMIGDTTHDLLMAHNASVRAVGIAQGAHSAEALAAVQPLCLLNTFSDFDAWLSTHSR